MSIMTVTTIITHKYLMNKTKYELASMVMDYARHEEELINILANIYNSDEPTPYSAVANLCDEKLDRSGALLGVVRDRAVELKGKMK